MPCNGYVLDQYLVVLGWGVADAISSRTLYIIYVTRALAVIGQPTGRSVRVMALIFSSPESEYRAKLYFSRQYSALLVRFNMVLGLCV